MTINLEVEVSKEYITYDFDCILEVTRLKNRKNETDFHDID